MPTKKQLPKPPGGQLVCSDEQLAIVEVKNGEIFAECHSPPTGAFKREEEMINWALETITNEKRAYDRKILYADEVILMSEKFERTDVNGSVRVVYFKLPKFIAFRRDGGRTMF